MLHFCGRVFCCAMCNCVGVCQATWTAFACLIVGTVIWKGLKLKINSQKLALSTLYPSHHKIFVPEFKKWMILFAAKYSSILPILFAATISGLICSFFSFYNHQGAFFVVVKRYDFMCTKYCRNKWDERTKYLKIMMKESGVMAHPSITVTTTSLFRGVWNPSEEFLAHENT